MSSRSIILKYLLHNLSNDNNNLWLWLWLSACRCVALRTNKYCNIDINMNMIIRISNMPMVLIRINEKLQLDAAAYTKWNFIEFVFSLFRCEELSTDVYAEEVSENPNEIFCKVDLNGRWCRSKCQWCTVRLQYIDLARPQCRCRRWPPHVFVHIVEKLEIYRDYIVIGRNLFKSRQRPDRHWNNFLWSNRMYDMPTHSTYSVVHIPLRLANERFLVPSDDNCVQMHRHRQMHFQSERIWCWWPDNRNTMNFGEDSSIHNSILEINDWHIWTIINLHVYTPNILRCNDDDDDAVIFRFDSICTSANVLWCQQSKWVASDFPRFIYHYIDQYAQSAFECASL